MIPISQFAAAEPSAEKISKTDWIDLALAAELTPDGHLGPDAYAAWSIVRAAAERYRLRCELVLTGARRLKDTAKLADLGADRLFVYETGAAFTPADALGAFCEDYKPAVLAFPNGFRPLAEALAAALKIGAAVDWSGPIELDRKKDLRSDDAGLGSIAASRPQLLVFAADPEALPLSAGEDEIPEIFFCFP